MATSFPSSLDSFTNPLSSDTLSSPSHAGQHTDLNDAVAALQSKVGADSSAVAASLDYKVAQLEAASTGKILQVVSTTKTDTFTASLGGGADTAITGFSATITPSSTSSTILVMVDAHMSDATDVYGRGAIRIYRGATSLAEGIGSGSRTTAFASSVVLQSAVENVMNIAGTYLDSPATTSATTYTVHAVNAWVSTKTIGCNRAGNDANSALNTRPSSTITLMEVGA